MKTNTINNANTANIQVYREENREQAGQTPKIIYYLGWGERDELIGDPMPFEELQALHALIGRVIEQNTTNN